MILYSKRDETRLSRYFTFFVYTDFHIFTSTGLYPEGHGLINNYIYDRNASKQLNPSNPNELDWVSGVPLYRNYYSQVCTLIT